MRLTRLHSAFPLATLLALAVAGTPARANNPGELSRLSARDTSTRTTAVRLQPGRVISIQFEGGDRIQAIVHGDRSRVVAFTNAPLESGFATILFLQPIQPQIFPGATRAAVPNLKVVTVGEGGRVQVHTFNLHFGGSGPDAISIGPGIATPPPQTVSTGYGPATADDLTAGLKVAIARGSLESTGATAARIRTFIGGLRNGETVAALMAQTGLGWDTLVALGSDGQAQRARERRDRFDSGPKPNDAAALLSPDGTAITTGDTDTAALLSPDGTAISAGDVDTDADTADNPATAPTEALSPDPASEADAQRFGQRLLSGLQIARDRDLLVAGESAQVHAAVAQLLQGHPPEEAAAAADLPLPRLVELANLSDRPTDPISPVEDGALPRLLPDSNP